MKLQHLPVRARATVCCSKAKTRSSCSATAACARASSRTSVTSWPSCAPQGRELEYVYVSHIDSDHISGVLQLLEDEVEWRVFDYQTSLRPATPTRARRAASAGDQRAAAQRVSRSDRHQHQTDVEDLLAAAVPSLFATADPRSGRRGAGAAGHRGLDPRSDRGLATVGAATRSTSPSTGCPARRGPAKLLFFRDTGAVVQGRRHAFTIVGPGEQELTDLKTGWVNWLRANQDDVRDLRGS